MVYARHHDKPFICVFQFSSKPHCEIGIITISVLIMNKQRLREVMDWSEVIQWWWWNQYTIQVVWLPANREIYNSLNQGLFVSRTYVLSHVTCLLLHRIPVWAHKLYSFNAQIFTQHLLGPRHWAKVFLSSHFLNPGRSSFLLLSFSRGGQLRPREVTCRQVVKLDTQPGNQSPRPKLSL